MNKEAYQKGFVKRAKEHGLTQKQAEGLMDGLSQMGGQALNWAKQNPEAAGAIGGGAAGFLGGGPHRFRNAALGALGGGALGHYSPQLYQGYQDFMNPSTPTLQHEPGMAMNQEFQQTHPNITPFN